MLECTSNADTGTGNVIVRHDFNEQNVQMVRSSSLELADTLLSYLAPSTDDELQAILTQSESCFQQLVLPSVTCINTTRWSSLSADMWSADMFPSDTGIKYITHKLALPVRRLLSY